MKKQFYVILTVTELLEEEITEWCYDQWDEGGEDCTWDYEAFQDVDVSIPGEIIKDQTYEIEFDFAHKKDAKLFVSKWQQYGPVMTKVG